MKFSITDIQLGKKEIGMKLTGRSIEKGIISAARTAWETANFNCIGIATAFNLTQNQEYGITMYAADSDGLNAIEHSKTASEMSRILKSMGFEYCGS